MEVFLHLIFASKCKNRHFLQKIGNAKIGICFALVLYTHCTIQITLVNGYKMFKLNIPLLMQKLCNCYMSKLIHIHQICIIFCFQWHTFNTSMIYQPTNSLSYFDTEFRQFAIVTHLSSNLHNHLLVFLMVIFSITIHYIR